jgi:hypothetical protein
MEELWKDIESYEGHYQISNMKRIKSLERISNNGKLLREKILKNSKHGNYEIVWLSKDGKQKLFYIDRLYYQHFK